jgi:large subunit ribosomal protein L15
VVSVLAWARPVVVVTKVRTLVLAWRYVRNGFEGGQMPLKIRLPKFGFFSRKSLVTAEVRLNEIALVEGDVVDLNTLKQAGVVTKNIEFAKVVLSGNIDRAVTVRGLSVTKGARAAIEAAGGKIEE